MTQFVKKKNIKDELGRELSPGFPPARIVSLVPSITELLFSLGLSDEVVGLTRFCAHPEPQVSQKTIIGGTQGVDIEKIRQLKPDLILAHKSENLKKEVEKLSKEFPVWVANCHNFEEALLSIHSIAQICDRSHAGNEMLKTIQNGFRTIRRSVKPLPVAYLIWRKPYLTINRNTFIHSMMEQCNFRNVFAEKSPEYPEISVDDILLSGARYVFLASEPYNFKLAHKQELQKALPKIKIVDVDGQFFSWYGSRMLEAPDYFNILTNSVLED